MGRVGWRAVIAVFTVALVTGAIGTAAIAEVGPSRSVYVAELEEVCEPGSKATQKAMDGVRQDVRHEKRIPVAAKKFERAAKIFGGTISEIAKYPRPPADMGRLKQWFKYLKRQEQYLVEIAGQLRKDRTIKAQRLTAHFIHQGNKANNVTLAFGFNYCSFRFSRYG
jgi:hypothetical protein